MWNRPKSSDIDNRLSPVVQKDKMEKPEQLGAAFVNQTEKLLGVSTVKSQDGTIITVPGSADSSEDFANFFMSAGGILPVFTDTIENTRMSLYDTYDQLDLYVSQCAITLDTYTDESLGTGFVDIPFTVWSNDPKCENYINMILKKNHFMEHLSSYVRSLFKYGDCGFLFHTPLNSDCYDPEELKFEFIRARDMKIFAEGEIEYKYEVGSINRPLSKTLSILYDIDNKKYRTLEEIRSVLTNKREKTEACAWDLCHWSIYNADYSPYGKSLLDNMRVLADQKTTMEVLMALGRASRIERLILEVVAPSSSPTVAMNQVQRTANTFKNMIMGADGAGGRNRNNNMGLTDVLTIPKGIVEVKKLNSSFDVASTQDVEYFRDELITLSRIQKSSFLADQSVNRGSTLESQDLRFARALVPYARAYEQGIYNLCVHIALLGGFDLTKTSIEVTTNRPAYVTKEYLQTYEQLSNSAANLLMKAGVTPENPEYNAKYTKMLRKLGMPEDYLRLMHTKQKVNPQSVNITPTNNDPSIGMGLTPVDQNSEENAETYYDDYGESVTRRHPEYRKLMKESFELICNKSLRESAVNKFNTKETLNECKVKKVRRRKA